MDADALEHDHRGTAARARPVIGEVALRRQAPARSDFKSAPSEAQWRRLMGSLYPDHERTPDGVAADGLGSAGAAKTVCVGCHQAAGSDAAHTPTAGGRDQVYTPIPPQAPPQGATAVEAWLAKGYYKQWACEPAIHAGRAPTPHGFNRICANQAISANVAGTAPWPAGAAAVKELYDSLTGAAPIGYAVYLKTAADSAAGAGWYWYERVPQPTGVVADGTGGAGPAKTICVACHQAAGADADHTPTAGGRDQVYTPVAGKP